MSVLTRIEPDHNLITYTATGELVLEEVRVAVTSIIRDPSFRLGMNAFWNLKEAQIGIGLPELPELITMLQGRNGRGAGFRVAILVRSNEDFGLSSIFRMHAYELPFEVQVFRSSNEARDWVTAPTTAGR